MISVSCAGDSITRAQHSVDYLGLLRARHPLGAIHTRGFGANRDFAYNLLHRLDEVVAHPADVITVLIGTNDARACLPGFPVDKAMSAKALPNEPSPAWFEDCLGRIVVRLRTETDARIGLLSLPVLGQDPASGAAQASAEYSRIIEQTASDHGGTYLPLHERQVRELDAVNPVGVPFEELTVARYLHIALQRKILRRSLDAISERRLLLLTTDHIHQNSRGASLIAEVIDLGMLGPPTPESGNRTSSPSRSGGVTHGDQNRTRQDVDHDRR